MGMKTELRKRAALRVNEQRQLERATTTLERLMIKHGMEGFELTDLYILKKRLEWNIRHQHIEDMEYAEHKKKQFPRTG